MFQTKIDMKTICIIGMGNMGSAMFNILKLNEEFKLIGCDQEHDINVDGEAADIFILAVKPQSFVDLAATIKIDLKEKLVISIMAGISIEKIQAALSCKKVVRTLPSLPLKVGKSLTIWKSDNAVSEEEKSVARNILISFGEAIEVSDEGKIDLIGSISGCGPAYFAYLGEKMADFCVKNGFSQVDADKIARQTLVGTGELVNHSGWGLKELRERVSSKGGITEAAINTLEENNFGAVFEKGVDAAVKRTNELKG